MRKMHLAAVVAIGFAALWGAGTQASEHGRELYEKRCTGCHALDNIKVGPPLRGVFGRRAAAHPSFPYSDALRAAKLKWDETTLDQWLADPEALVAGNDMAFRMNQADERSAIIAYLKQLPAKQAHP